MKETKSFREKTPMPQIHNASFSPKVPSVVYHYTRRGGLQGIFNTKVLWATNIRYLNDASEFSTAVQVAEAVLDEIGANDLEKYKKTALDKFRSWIAPQNNQQYQAYVCSFSEDWNSLSQWRSYCKAGDGYAIGFDTKALNELALGQSFSQLVPCLYDELPQKRLISSLLVAELDQFHPDSDPNQFAGSCLLKFLRIAPLVKNKGFEEEREWRLVAALRPNPPPGLSFRSGKSMVIPYIKFSLTKGTGAGNMGLPVKEVVVGPSPHGPLDSVAVRQLTGVDTRWSPTPFRDW